MSDNQMEQAEKFLHLIYKPGVLAVMSAILSPLFGLVVALILAAFLKRQPAAVAEVTPPVT
jgi:phosphate/sulfate permease